MSLVTGYDSDDSDGGEAPQPSRPGAHGGSAGGLAALLPPPSAVRTNGKGPPLAAPISSATPPPPPPSLPKAAGTKRRSDKLQIRIDALDPRDDDGEGASSSKRAKNVGGTGGSGGGGGGGGSSSSSSGTTGRHGLLGMLPAPSRTGPPTPPRADRGEPQGTETGPSSVRINKLGLDESASAASEGFLVIQEGESSKKIKGNNDFRAMLGLKPVQRPSKGEAQAGTTVPSSAKASDPKPAHAAEAVTVSGPAKEEQPVKGDTTTGKPIPLNFFGLGEPSRGDEAGDAALPPQPASSAAKSAFSVSLAPQVEDDSEAQRESAAQDVTEIDPYEGWQQGADGEWFPVTPAAHARYEAYVSTQAEARATREEEMRLRGIDPRQVQNVDANANLDNWLASRDGAGLAGKPAGAGAGQASVSSSIDKRYVQAAASMATPEQARALGLEPADGGEDDEDGDNEERKKREKAINYRARKRGQLSSLVAQASENRDQLEEKWAQGRAKRNEARNRYGW